VAHAKMRKRSPFSTSLARSRGVQGTKVSPHSNNAGQLQAWLKTSGCEPSCGRADKVRVNARLAMSQALRSSLLSSHPVIWTNTDGSGHGSFSPTLESVRPVAELVSNLGPGLRAHYGDPLTGAVPDCLGALLERLSSGAMGDGAE